MSAAAAAAHDDDYGDDVGDGTRSGETRQHATVNA